MSPLAGFFGERISYRASAAQPSIRITIDAIQSAVASRCRIPIAEMVSARRARRVARPRQIAMYLAKQLTPQSLPQIGRRFGGRDHTTVIHAVKRITDLRAEDADLNADIEAVERLFGVIA